MSKRKKDLQPFWRPNFVDPSELPDIKIIRTDFVINLVAVILALSLISMLAQREYRAHSLSKTIAELEQQIQDADPNDKASLKIDKSFRSSAEHVVELDKFIDTPLKPHQFLYELSAIKPKDLIFNSISIRESSVKKDGENLIAYRITISGDARSLTVVDQFKGILEEARFSEMKDYGISVNERLEGRDEKTGIFPYRLSVSMNPRERTVDDEGDGA